MTVDEYVLAWPSAGTTAAAGVVVVCLATITWVLFLGKGGGATKGHGLK